MCSQAREPLKVVVLLPAGLPIQLTPLLLRLRFDFADLTIVRVYK